MSDYEDDIGLWNWGPMWRSIDHVMTKQVPHLNEARAQQIKSNRASPERAAMARERAFKAARDEGRITEVVSASEDLRRCAWQQVFTTSQAVAWEVSWALANVGIALATFDLIDPEHYTMDDYAALMFAWFAAYRDEEIPR